MAKDKTIDPETQAIFDQKKAELEKLPGVWFLVHVHTGNEKSVADGVRLRVQAAGAEDLIYEVAVPEYTDQRNQRGKLVTVINREVPGYILVRMVNNDDEDFQEAWSIVRLTPGVTGFAGLPATPISISLDEVIKCQKKSLLQAAGKEIEEKQEVIVDQSGKQLRPFEEGEVVLINNGPFRGTEGKVSHIDEHHKTLKVNVNVFGRETPVEFSFDQVSQFDK